MPDPLHSSDVCGEAAEFGLVEPAAGSEVHALCAYHLARFALDRVAGRTD